jgi:hypothetical protein
LYRLLRVIFGGELLARGTLDYVVPEPARAGLEDLFDKEPARVFVDSLVDPHNGPNARREKGRVSQVFLDLANI